MDQPYRRLILGITGGIAAYKIPSLIRTLTKDSFEVKVIMTRAAQPLVGEGALRALSGNPVYTDQTPSGYDMDHIRLSEWGDILLIAPATANTIAKIARGFADNLLTTTVLSFKGPILAAPAMNSAMWLNPATQDAVRLLSERGIGILPVESGPLACGDEGPGRMLGIDTIAAFVRHADVPRCFKGKKILIASGPTMEPIDPVRVITNRSSGLMGSALATTALCMGASVTVVHGANHTPLPEGIHTVPVQTAAQMSTEMVSRFDECDLCIMAAAVGDFKPAETFTEKMHRHELETVQLKLVHNEDIAAALGSVKKQQFLVCFSLESREDGLQRAKSKMAAKRCDLMVFNSIQAIGESASSLTLLFPDDSMVSLPLAKKTETSKQILLSAAQRLGLYDGSLDT